MSTVLRRLLLAVAAAAVLTAPAFARSAVSEQTNTLKSVSIAGGRIHARYALSKTSTAYAIQFYSPSLGAWSLQDFYLLPELPRDSIGVDEGTVTRTAWTSTTDDLHLIQGGGKETVRLLYAPKASCRSVARCKHIKKTDPVVVTVGSRGPGRLVGTSDAYGDFASASVSGSVATPFDFTIRVSSAPSNERVDVDWTLTCSKGQSVKGKSGSTFEYTPASDETSIAIPFDEPDSCIVAVGASLSDEGDSIRLSVYSHSWK